MTWLASSGIPIGSICIWREVDCQTLISGCGTCTGQVGNTGEIGPRRPLMSTFDFYDGTKDLKHTDSERLLGDTYRLYCTRGERGLSRLFQAFRIRLVQRQMLDSLMILSLRRRLKSEKGTY